MGNYIYTIGRELGSGGYTVAKLLAERLGIKLYDKELLAQAAKDSGFCEEIFENHDERPTNSFLYSLFSAACCAAVLFLNFSPNSFYLLCVVS